MIFLEVCSLSFPHLDFLLSANCLPVFVLFISDFCAMILNGLFCFPHHFRLFMLIITDSSDSDSNGDVADDVDGE